MRKIALILPILFLSACATGHYQDYLNIRKIAPPTPAQFTHCYNYGCHKKQLVSLSQETQNRLINHFRLKSQTAEKERKLIASAIQIFEEDIGKAVGTKNDKRGTFRLYQDPSPEAKSFQQDCIDESTNTTIYLALLEQMNLIQFHTPVFAASRQPFFGGAPWWHQTAVMKEINTGKRFAVDSWFRDNGHPAYIIPLKEWKAGWLPPKPSAK